VLASRYERSGERPVGSALEGECASEGIDNLRSLLLYSDCTMGWLAGSAVTEDV